MGLLPVIAVIGGQGGTTPPPPDPVDNSKVIQVVEDVDAYEAFGSPCKVTANHVVYCYRKAADHLTGGDIYYRIFNITTRTWSSATLLISDDLDLRDAYISASLINDRVIVSTSTYTGALTDTTPDMFFQKFSVNPTTGALTADGARVQITGVNGVEQLQRESLFGPITTADNGKHYAGLQQWEGSRAMIQCLEFSADMSTWTAYTIWDSTLPYYENCVVVMPAGKFICLARVDNGGTLEVFESTDYGHTWTSRDKANIYHWKEGFSSMCYGMYLNGFFHIITCVRDARSIFLSPANTIASNFGSTPATYNGPEMFAYNKTVGAGNVALGYPSMSCIDETYGDYGLWLCIWTRELGGDKANLYWCVTDFVTDSGAPVAPPSISISAIDTDGFRFDIDGYTDAQIADIRHWELDLSTDPAFGSFVTGKYRNPSAYPATSTIQNIQLNALWTIFNSLTSGTTYYLRIRAKNNIGNSSYTTVNATTS